ncbi:hypothetical protein CSUI_005452 [Cystoisospora suis]|uniref:Uncharacterized protein n=1 Tax=Cystoisospora suis TaxID=483139 RepID=A0A2C6KX12_9APIC|nr:hypothetical protein CSUI_005452 [Cystoisospora suis]
MSSRECLWLSQELFPRAGYFLTLSHPRGGLTTSSESDSTAGFPSQSQNSSTASPSPEGSLTTSAHSDFTVTSPVRRGAPTVRRGHGDPSTVRRELGDFTFRRELDAYWTGRRV